MKNKIVFITFLVFFCNCQAREVITLQSGWKFARGANENAFKTDFDDSRWQEVTIPHDWAITGPFIQDGDGNTGKLPWKGEGWYRNALHIPQEYKDKCVYIVFDGIMSSPEIYINGKLAGKWDYGYNSFYLDITGYLLFNNGPNTIAIHADTRNHDSRWYPGAGIFRKIQMIVVNPVHVDIWGTYITTPVVKPNYANVRIVNSISNKSAFIENEITVENIIISPEGKEICSKIIRGKIPGGTTGDIETTITLTNPQKWDINNGVMYSVKTIISSDNGILDVSTTKFGIRTIRFTADHGFYLNDKRVQLKGVNLHHDHGPLGAAFYPRAMERQLGMMKTMGCNAIRTSHNTAAPELLDLCDKMGILVFNEVFDKYDQKSDIPETAGFEEFASRNIRNFVVRDRTHPSVFIWSVGNEMGDVQMNLNNGFEQLKTMLRYVHKYDTTRPATMVCDNRNSAVNRHFDFYDVHCWNYGRRYDLARQLEPAKSVIISESASTVSTRGFYESLPETKTDFTKSLQVSSYDLNAPWWAEISDDDFMWQQEEEYVAGEFVWTGFDYLGEPTPYTNEWVKQNGMTDNEAAHSSYFGIVDLCGIPKDRYYLYKSYWKPDETTVHILPHWNWPGMEGKKIPVFVYTNGDCAELFLNGMSLGMKCKVPDSKISVERFRLMWKDATYEPGELKAVAYKEGEAIGENVLKTAGEPYRLRLTPDRLTIHADGNDLSYILIEAFDKDGNLCPLADNLIDLKLAGPGTIAGVGNGNPRSYEPYQANYIQLFNGKAMLIIRSESRKGNIEITATSKGLVQDNKLIKTE